MPRQPRPRAPAAALRFLHPARLSIHGIRGREPARLGGALVLGSSIRSFDSSRDLVCLVIAAVPVEWRSALEVAGWTVKEVAEVQEFWWGKSEECSRSAGDQVCAAAA